MVRGSFEEVEIFCFIFGSYFVVADTLLSIGRTIILRPNLPDTLIKFNLFLGQRHFPACTLSGWQYGLNHTLSIRIVCSKQVLYWLEFPKLHISSNWPEVNLHEVYFLPFPNTYLYHHFDTCYMRKANFIRWCTFEKTLFGSGDAFCPSVSDIESPPPTVLKYLHHSRTVLSLQTFLLYVFISVQSISTALWPSRKQLDQWALISNTK